MAKLPLTVTQVVAKGNGMWAVTVAFADGTTANYLVPTTLATVEAVTFASVALAVLSDPDIATSRGPGGKHRRYAPRT